MTTILQITEDDALKLSGLIEVLLDYRMIEYQRDYWQTLAETIKTQTDSQKRGFFQCAACVEAPELSPGMAIANPIAVNGVGS